MLDDFSDSFSRRRHIGYSNNYNFQLQTYQFLYGLLAGGEYDIDIALKAALLKSEKYTYNFLHQITKGFEKNNRTFYTFDEAIANYCKDKSYEESLYSDSRESHILDVLNNCPVCYSCDVSFEVDYESSYYECSN